MSQRSGPDRFGRLLLRFLEKKLCPKEVYGLVHVSHGTFGDDRSRVISNQGPLRQESLSSEAVTKAIPRIERAESLAPLNTLSLLTEISKASLHDRKHLVRMALCINPAYRH